MLGSDTLLDHLVVDTGPLIRNIKFDKLAQRLVTTRGVLQEVKDAFTRQKLELLPIEIEEQRPSDKSLKFVLDFAKQTGDVRSLSNTDLAVVALTYDLESSLNGTEHLRKSPVTTIKVNEGFGDDKITNLAGFYVPKSMASSTSSRTTSVSTTAKPDTIEPIIEDDCVEDDSVEDDLTDCLDQCELDEGWTTVPKKKSEADGEMEEFILPDDILVSADDDIELEDEEYEFDDNDDDWITPSNISEKKTESLLSIKVGCATTDFAMQNLLLQIGLHVVSVDGMLIKYAKIYVLKCTACFTVVKDCSNVFCTKCGNKTLEKVAVTVDEDGITWYQRLSRKPRTGRGVRFSLPKPQGGRQAANSPWITPDQPDKVHKMASNFKSSVDVMSGDFVKSGSPFGTTNVDSKAFLFKQSAGRRSNPNERTKRTGNRKKKKR